MLYIRLYVYCSIRRYAYDAVDENSVAYCFSEEKLLAAADEEF